MTLLLQPPIRCCDKPVADGLALQTFDVLDEYALVLRAPCADLTTRLGGFATNSHE